MIKLLACAVAGASEGFAEARPVGAKRGKIGVARGFSGLWVKALRGKRSIADDLIFGSFYQVKEQSPPAANEPGQALSVMAYQSDK